MQTVTHFRDLKDECNKTASGRKKIHAGELRGKAGAGGGLVSHIGEQR